MIENLLRRFYEDFRAKGSVTMILRVYKQREEKWQAPSRGLVGHLVVDTTTDTILGLFNEALAD